MVSWKNFWGKAIDDYKNKGYTSNHIEEIKTITIANKMDMPYDFYFNYNMHAVEWKLFSLINKNKALISNFNRNWRHP